MCRNENPGPEFRQQGVTFHISGTHVGRLAPYLSQELQNLQLQGLKHPSQTQQQGPALLKGNNCLDLETPSLLCLPPALFPPALCPASLTSLSRFCLPPSCLHSVLPACFSLHIPSRLDWMYAKATRVRCAEGPVPRFSCQQNS